MLGILFFRKTGQPERRFLSGARDRGHPALGTGEDSLNASQAIEIAQNGLVNGDPPAPERGQLANSGELNLRPPFGWSIGSQKFAPPLRAESGAPRT